jgi:hypothetical protein
VALQTSVGTRVGSLLRVGLKCFHSMGRL